MRHGRLALVAACFLGNAVGCGDPYVDFDDVADKATGLTDLEIDDDLDADKGDIVDWKYVQPGMGGKGKLHLTLGDPFKSEPHGLKGDLVVFTERAEQVTRVAFAPGEKQYDVTWDVVLDAKYLVRLSASDGIAAYKLKFAVEEVKKDPPHTNGTDPKDPCAGVTCGEGEKCVDGECEEGPPPAGDCDPACTGDKICVDHKCEKPCGGKCKKGERCSPSKNECLKDPCAGKKCGANEKCKAGACVSTGTTPQPKKTCDPACGPGEKCEGTKCVPVPEAATTGPITATVIQIIPGAGATSTAILNVGSKNNVQVGNTGKMGSFSLKVTQVGATSCRANVSGSAADVGAIKKATVVRN